MGKIIKLHEPEMVKCEQCDGDGWRYHEANSVYTRPCYRCNETGLVPKQINKQLEKNKWQQLQHF